MKKLFWQIFSCLLLIGVLVGVGFYCIPKFATKTTNGWVEFIDKIIPFVVANWVSIVIILSCVLVIVILSIILIKINQRKNKRIYR